MHLLFEANIDVINHLIHRNSSTHSAFPDWVLNDKIEVYHSVLIKMEYLKKYAYMTPMLHLRCQENKWAWGHDNSVIIYRRNFDRVKDTRNRVT